MWDALHKLLLMFASQIPLFGAIYQWREQAQQRPLIAALLAVGYELLIVMGAFIKTVWTDELKKDAVKFTADWVRSGVKGFAPGFLHRYRKQMIIEHNIFNVRGLGLIDAVTLNLDQVFVELQIARSNSPVKASLDPVAARELQDSRQIWDFVNVFRRHSNAPVALAVIGPPGCGKTTLLQHVAVTLAANRQRRYRSRAYVPILLFLREHIAKITQEKPPLAELMQEHFTNKHPISRLNPPLGWFAKQLDQGKCMVLMDGLDEVADAEQRRIVSAWVDQQINNFPECPFILTARPQGYRDAPLSRAHVLEVLPFNAGQIRRFIDNWYLASEIIKSGNKQDEGVRQRAAIGTRELLKALNEKPSLNDLTVNPLLLTMVAMVHRYHGALPGSRVELYAEICQVLLGRWRQARGVKDKVSAEQKLVVLRPLAAHMMTNKIREITVKSAREVIADPLERIGVNSADAEKFLSDTQSGSGLLLEREVGRWSFAHLTFQEFLTAAHWLEQKETGCDWVAMVSDSWWHETLHLYAAQGDATPVAQACIDVDSVTSLTLAANCLEEARELAPEVRYAVEERVIAGLESEDTERRRLAAEVKLSRRLASLKRIDQCRAIDLGLLTCAEYQLFLNEMRAQEKYYQPDHWPNHYFEKDEAGKPVVGVRAEDAEAYCEWLTRKQGGEVIYRLPRPDEALDDAIEEDEIAFWCKEDNVVHLAGMLDAAKKRIQQQLKSIFDFDSTSRSSPPFVSTAMDDTKFIEICAKTSLDKSIYNLHSILSERDVATWSTVCSFLINDTTAHVRTFYRDLDQVFNSARNLVRDLDNSNYHAVACDLDHTFERLLVLARNLTQAFDLTVDRTRNLRVDHDIISSLQIAFVNIHTLAHELKLRLTRDPARDIILSFARTHVRARALALDQAVAIACKSAQDIETAVVIAYISLSSLNLVFDRVLHRDLDTKMIYQFGQTMAKEEKRDSAEVSHLLQLLLVESETLPFLGRELLSDILTLSGVNMPSDIRHTQRKMVALLLKDKLAGHPNVTRTEHPWWRRLSSRELSHVTEDSARENAKAYYWWLQIIIAREEGKLPAWEGIRILRELPQEGI